MGKKAEKTAAQLRKGRSVRSARVHYRTKFFARKPKTIARKPVHVRNAKAHFNLVSKLDKYSVLRKALSTQKCMSLMDKCNVLTFLVDNKATKPIIKKAFKDIHNIEPVKINTMIMPNGKKKAFIKLKMGTNSAVDLANKLGMI